MGVCGGEGGCGESTCMWELHGGECLYMLSEGDKCVCVRRRVDNLCYHGE